MRKRRIWIGGIGAIVFAAAAIATGTLLFDQDLTPTAYAARATAGDAKKSGPPAFHDRVFVVGWSLAGGFGTQAELGFDAPLALVLDQMIKPKHEPVAARIGGAFYRSPVESAKLQLTDAYRANPTMLVAIDFPFWFVYGSAKNENERLTRLETCLEWLDRFPKIPIVVGTCPSLESGGGFIQSIFLDVEKEDRKSTRLNSSH